MSTACPSRVLLIGCWSRQYGELEDLIVLENLGDHLIGNLYVKYNKEEQSDAALKGTACFSFVAALELTCV
jgi:hypothetical protein